MEQQPQPQQQQRQPERRRGAHPRGQQRGGIAIRGRGGPIGRGRGQGGQQDDIQVVWNGQLASPE